jgi:hypothetical protein
VADDGSPHGGSAAGVHAEVHLHPASVALPLPAACADAILRLMAIVIFVIIIVLVAVGIWYGWYAKQKRREALARMAASLGLTYEREDPFGLVGLPFELMERGDGQGVENVMAGTWQSVALKEFDYWYYTESTDSKGNTSKSYHYFSCAVTEVPIDAAALTISHENVFTRIGDHLGFEDIQFESEDFNRAYRVKSKDQKFATDLVDARMMQWLLPQKGWGFEFTGPFLLAYSKRRKPADLIPLLGTLRAFRDHIPRVVYDLHGTKPPEGTYST